MSRESFLKRWSRRKLEPAETRPAEPEPVESDVPPQLPPVEELDFESDFVGFMHPKVDRDTRNAALKKLFASPHYQVSDGLDVYVGDYSAPAVLPAAMLAGLEHARVLLATDPDGDAAGPGPVASVKPSPDLARATPVATAPSGSQAPDQSADQPAGESRPPVEPA